MKVKFEPEDELEKILVEQVMDGLLKMEFDPKRNDWLFSQTEAGKRYAEHLIKTKLKKQ